MVKATPSTVEPMAAKTNLACAESRIDNQQRFCRTMVRLRQQQQGALQGWENDSPSH
jgi:hypothetical protein